MILPISKIPDQETLLRTRSAEVDLSVIASTEFQTFLNDMIDTMYSDDGIGLAAPQVGKNIRVFVIGKDAVHDVEVLEGTLKAHSDIAIINPVWEKTSRKMLWDTEGCLSVPQVFGEIKRYKHITLRGIDRQGNPLRINANNFFARVIQHEVDHLNGVLFIDNARNIKRSHDPHRL